VGGPQPGDAARHAGREVPGHGAIPGLSLGVEIHVAAARRRRRFAKVERVGLSVDVRHHEAAAADVAGAWQHCGQGERDRNRRVDGIAAAPQHGDACFGSERLVGDDHAVFAFRGRLAERERPAAGDGERCRGVRCNASGGCGLRSIGAGRARGEQRAPGNGDSKPAGHGGHCTGRPTDGA
jgi:hypothetical protein